jgi:hypothetical protein
MDDFLISHRDFGAMGAPKLSLRILRSLAVAKYGNYKYFDYRQRSSRRCLADAVGEIEREDYTIESMGAGQVLLFA